MIDPLTLDIRTGLCADCRIRSAACDGIELANPCVACPRGVWVPVGCFGAQASEPAAPLPGDRLAAAIERQVLAPIEQAMPAAAGVVQAIRRCGGCHQARQRLGSTEAHRDSGTMI